MKPFRFKQFTLEQDRCAMKVGTDGVLLGAWTSVNQNPDTILDIGAGTGLIALMLAQRSEAQTIDAIEIDEHAYEQCVENFEASSWGDRLFCYHASLEEFADEIDEKYDLIVSNPPFYTEEISSGNSARDRARQNSSLPFEELLEGIAALLSKNGIFATVIPFREEERFLKLALGFGLHPQRKMRVRGNPGSEIVRSLLEFSVNVGSLQTDELTIELKRHDPYPGIRFLNSGFLLKNVAFYIRHLLIP